MVCVTLCLKMFQVHCGEFCSTPRNIGVNSAPHKHCYQHVSDPVFKCLISITIASNPLRLTTCYYSIVRFSSQNNKTAGYSYRKWPLNPKGKVQPKKFFGIKLQLFRRWNNIEIFDMVQVQLLDTLSNFLQKWLVILRANTDNSKCLKTIKLTISTGWTL